MSMSIQFYSYISFPGNAAEAMSYYAEIFGGTAQMGQGWAALASTWRPAQVTSQPPPATGPGWEGWATPPAYTRRPTVYLNAVPEGADVELPEGSVVSLRLYGSGAAVAQERELGGRERARAQRSEREPRAASRRAV